MAADDSVGLSVSVSVLYNRGESANLLSIGAIDFGIIVDSSVIIVENIYRHIATPSDDRSKPLIQRIAEGVDSRSRDALFLYGDHYLARSFRSFR